MSRPPLHAIPGFVAVAKHGSLSAAAAQLHLTVSALSHQISGLEQRLRVQLFTRGPRGVALTGDGERLFREIGPHYEALERALRTPTRQRRTTLALSTLPSFGTSWLVPRLPAFLAAHPDLELNLSSGIELVDFARDEFDAALRYGAGDWPGLHQEHLFDEWLVPVAAPQLASGAGTRSRRALEQWPLLGDPDGIWQRWFEQHGGTPPRRYVAHFDASETRMRAAAEGLGVALAPALMARPLLEAKRLVQLSPKRLRAGRAYWLVYPSRSADHPPLLAFRDWLRAERAR